MPCRGRLFDVGEVGCKDLRDTEVVASGGSPTLLQATTVLFPNFQCIRQLLFNYCCLCTHTHTHATYTYTPSMPMAERRLCAGLTGTHWSLCFPSSSAHTDSPKWKSKVVCVQPQPENLLHRLGCTHRLPTSQWPLIFELCNHRTQDYFSAIWLWIRQQIARDSECFHGEGGSCF